MKAKEPNPNCETCFGTGECTNKDGSITSRCRCTKRGHSEKCEPSECSCDGEYTFKEYRERIKKLEEKAWKYDELCK